MCLHMLRILVLNDIFFEIADCAISVGSCVPQVSAESHNAFQHHS